MGDPSGIRQMIDSYFEPDRGPEWVRTLHDQRRRDIFAMTGGSWKLGSSVGDFRCNSSPPAPRKSRALGEKGLPIKQLFLPKQVGMLRACGSGCCISAFANAPHANAAKLFINWFLTKEGQTLTHTLSPEHRPLFVAQRCSVRRSDAGPATQTG